MVLRETSFLLGGALMIGLGVALAAGLLWAGAGLDYFGGWLAAGLAVGLGVFFLKVGRAEGQDRRESLARLERQANSTDPPGKP